MKRILQMPVRDRRGGVTQYVLKNWSTIDKKRFLFDWVTLDERLGFEDELISKGCHVYHLSCRQENDEACFREEMRAILANGYDAIHLHTSWWRGWLAEELAKEAGVKQIIVHAHTTEIGHPDAKERERLLSIHNEWKRRLRPELATHFVACSESAAEFLFGEQIPKDRIHILRNGIDTHRFEFNEEVRRSMRQRLGLDGKFVLLQAARLEYEKNFEFSIKVYSEYVKRDPDPIFLIVGSGSLESKLKSLARPLGERVRFLGFRQDIPELLMASDVFLQPSHFEGFSIASIEAQCSGIEYVASEGTGEAALPDDRVVLPLKHGLWIEALEAAKTARRNVDAAKELRAAGWDIRDTVKRLEELYEER